MSVHDALGRKKMPQGWKSPLKQKLYRVVVEARGEKEPLAVTPGVTEDVAQEFAAAMRAMIIKGLEKNWSNPTVVLCHT